MLKELDFVGHFAEDKEKVDENKKMVEKDKGLLAGDFAVGKEMIGSCKVAAFGAVQDMVTLHNPRKVGASQRNLGDD